MRCAVIVTDGAGRQLLGITDAQALLHVKAFGELPKYEFGGLRVTFVVEPTPQEVSPSLWYRLWRWMAPRHVSMSA